MCFFFHHSVGKTSLLHQYIHKRFYEDYRTTLGASILSKVMEVDHTPLKLQVTDVLMSQISYSMLSQIFIAQSNVLQRKDRYCEILSYLLAANFQGRSELDIVRRK